MSSMLATQATTVTLEIFQQHELVLLLLDLQKCIAAFESSEASRKSVSRSHKLYR